MKKEKKLEEEKILAEMDEAMKEQSQEEKTQKNSKLSTIFQDKTPQQLHCRKCQTMMKDGVCPTCGFRMYVGMDKEKQKQIRMIAGGVCLLILLLILLLK